MQSKQQMNTKKKYQQTKQTIAIDPRCVWNVHSELFMFVVNFR